jgi:hypothetical protein
MTMRFFILALLGLVLTACAAYEGARERVFETARAGVAPAVIAECKLSAAERRGRLDRINGELAERDSPARVTPIDCDGDGEPDPI